MAYTVDFGTIVKRENSTANTFTASVSADCLLKDGTDILRPTFSLQLSSDFPMTANYMHVSSFGRYYWITGIYFERGVWYVSGEIDVLGTYKSEIGGTSAYILRAASENNEYIPDTIFPYRSDCYDNAQTWNVGFDGSNGGTVIITCAGNNNLVPNTESYYALVDFMWQELYTECFSTQFLQDMDNAWSGLSNLLLNGLLRPEDYISNAIWLPIDYTDIPGTAKQICLGFTQTAAAGKPISPASMLFSDQHSFTIPDHPQISTYGKWLNGNGTRMTSVFLPGYGSVALDSDLAIEPNSTVDISWGVDCTGIINYRVTQGDLIQHYAANISTPVGWNVARPDVFNMIGNIGQALNPATMSIGAIGNALASALPHVDRICSGGSRVLPSLAPSIRVNTKAYLLPADLDFTTTGRPLGTMRQINTLSGYILCDSTVNVACGGTREEIDRIKGYLTGGVYYE